MNNINIIKLSHVKDVINLLDKEEITMSKVAEILNDIVLEAENEKLNELYKKYFDLQDYTLKIQQELIELKRNNSF